MSHWSAMIFKNMLKLLNRTSHKSVANKNCIRSTYKKVKITRINQIQSIFSHDTIYTERALSWHKEQTAVALEIRQTFTAMKLCCISFNMHLCKALKCAIEFIPLELTLVCLRKSVMYMVRWSIVSSITKKGYTNTFNSRWTIIFVFGNHPPPRCYFDAEIFTIWKFYLKKLRDSVATQHSVAIALYTEGIKKIFFKIHWIQS